MNKTASVKTVKLAQPTKATATTVEPKKEKPLTQEEIEAKKDAWWKNHTREMRELKEKRKELKEELQVSAEINNKEDEPVFSDETEDEFLSSKQKRICKKHGLKHRKLRKAVEQVKRLIVTKLGSQIDNEYLIAIIELLTYGDIGLNNRESGREKKL